MLSRRLRGLSTPSLLWHGCGLRRRSGLLARGSICELCACQPPSGSGLRRGRRDRQHFFAQCSCRVAYSGDRSSPQHALSCSLHHKSMVQTSRDKPYASNTRPSSYQAARLQGAVRRCIVLQHGTYMQLHIVYYIVFVWSSYTHLQPIYSSLQHSA